MPDISGADGLPELLVKVGAMRPRVEHGRCLAQHFGGRVAAELTKGRIDPQYTTRLVGDEDRRSQTFQGRRQQGLQLRAVSRD